MSDERGALGSVSWGRAAFRMNGMPVPADRLTMGCKGGGPATLSQRG